MFLNPSVGSITNNGEQPSPRLLSSKLREAFPGPRKGFLNHILGILFCSQDPARKVIGCIQVRQEDLFEGWRLWHYQADLWLEVTPKPGIAGIRHPTKDRRGKPITGYWTTSKSYLT